MAEPVLVGREQELAKLHAYLDLALAGKGATVFVSGEAGSGKTRLTNEFLHSAKKKGVKILTGWCLSNAPVPYFPFIEAFESNSSQDESDNKFQASKQLSLKTLFVDPNQERKHQSRRVFSSLEGSKICSGNTVAPVFIFRTATTAFHR